MRTERVQICGTMKIYKEWDTRKEDGAGAVSCTQLHTFRGIDRTTGDTNTEEIRERTRRNRIAEIFKIQLAALGEINIAHWSVRT